MPFLATVHQQAACAVQIESALAAAGRRRPTAPASTALHNSSQPSHLSLILAQPINQGVTATRWDLFVFAEPLCQR